MPIEEDFTNTLRAELSSCEPDLLVVLAEGVRRGRRRRRQRAAVLGGAAVLLAGGFAGAVSPGLTRPTGAPSPDTVVAAPATPSPGTPSPTASPSLATAPPWAWSADAVGDIFDALRPSGIVETAGPPPDPGSGVETNLQLDDGAGACRLAISAEQLAGDPLAQRRTVMADDATALADGTRMLVQQVPARAGQTPYQRVEALTPSGMDVVLTLWSASSPDSTRVRATPVLTADQLTTIATSPLWETGT